MENKKTKEILSLRLDGMSYNQIALTLGMSVNTIKSHFQRNKITNKAAEVYPKEGMVIECQFCGIKLKQKPRGKTKKFCSDSCRRAWWKENPEHLDKRAYYTLVCSGCGKDFKSYGNMNRIYCSHSCYIKKRFKESGECV